MLRKIHISIQRSATDIKTTWSTSYADPEKNRFQGGGRSTSDKWVSRREIKGLFSGSFLGILNV